LPRLRLPENLRARLKEPLGELIPGPPEKSLRRLRQILDSEKIPKIVCVGDFVTRLLSDSSIGFDLAIVDNKVMRQEAGGHSIRSKQVFHVVNPAGTLEVSAWAAIGEALKAQRALLVVDGEEDLLTLPAIMLAPCGSLVLYGQPREGMIAVRVDKSEKSEIESLISEMIRE